MIFQRSTKIRVLCFLLLAIAVCPAGASFLFWGKDKEDPLAKGMALYGEGHYAQAESELSGKLASLDTQDKKRAYWFIGSCYEQEGKLDHALSDYQLAVQIYPRDMQLLLALGRLYLRIGLPDRAAKIFSTMLAIEPDSFEAHIGIADVYAGEGFLSKAAEHYKTALDSMTVRDLSVWRAYASTLLESRHYAQAREVMTHVLSINPDDPDSLLLSARLYYEMGLHESALETIGRAAARAPKRNDIVLRRALWLISAGETDHGLGIAFGVLEREPQEPLALFTAGLALIKKGEADHARQYLERAAAQESAPFIAKAAAGLLGAMPAPSK
jgi:tetratricopeptide (TPR) repeat protein